MSVNSFFSRLLCLSNVRSCLIFLFSDHLFSFFLYYYPDISFKIIANENCICCYFSTQLKIKLYNFTASKYKMLWIMLFMNHKRPAFCLLCNSRSSTNNKAQMMLRWYYTEYVLLLSSNLQCAHKTVHGFAFVTSNVPMQS